MNKIEFKKLKKERTKTFLEIRKRLLEHNKDYMFERGDLFEVNQWGSVARLIFAYMMIEQVHSEEMDKKVQKLKDLSLQITEQKGLNNLVNKTAEHTQALGYNILTSLMKVSIDDGIPYVPNSEITYNEIVEQTNEFLNSRIIRGKKTSPLQEIKKEYIEKFGIVGDSGNYSSNVQCGIELINQDYNKAKKVYEDGIKNETNPKILEIIKKYDRTR